MLRTWPRRFCLLICAGMTAGVGLRCIPVSANGWGTLLAAPTTSWFEAEQLPGDSGNWFCGGLVDLNGDGVPEAVAFASDSIRIYQQAPSGWQVQDVALTSAAMLPKGIDPVGCEAADLDGNGTIDLIVAVDTHGVVLLNDGHLNFQQVPLPALPNATNVEVEAVGAIDADGDGLPELFIARNSRSAAITFQNDGCTCTPDGRVRCGLSNRTYLGAPSVLLHNLGRGQFQVVSGSGAESPYAANALGVYDVDGDGRQDLVLADDGMPNRVYLNGGNLTFTDVTAQLGITEHNHGMGVALGDLDGDGVNDLAFSEIGVPLIMLGQGHRFQTLDDPAHGITPIADSSQGTEMEDFDNDGALDLMFFNVNVDQVIPFETCSVFSQWPQAQLSFYRNDGTAHFSPEQPVQPGTPLWTKDFKYAGGQALAVGDLDGDGVLDAFVLAQENKDDCLPTSAWVLHGHAPAGNHWVTVAAPQGAVVELCTNSGCRRREIAGAHSAYAIHPREVHFGLGQATGASVKVEWPHGSVHNLGAVPIDHRTVWSPAAQ